MLTRNDCWEPLETRGYRYLEGPGPVPDRPGKADRAEPILQPEAVERVIRAIRQMGVTSPPGRFSP